MFVAPRFHWLTPRRPAVEICWARAPYLGAISSSTCHGSAGGRVDQTSRCPWVAISGWPRAATGGPWPGGRWAAPGVERYPRYDRRAANYTVNETGSPARMVSPPGRGERRDNARGQRWNDKKTARDKGLLCLTLISPFMAINCPQNTQREKESLLAPP